MPLDLVDKLARTLKPSDAPGIVVSSSQGLQPTYGLWRVKALAALRAALEAGRLQLRLLCSELEVAVLDCRAEDLGKAPFYNVNTAADLTLAEAMSAGKGLSTTAGKLGFSAKILVMAG